MKNLFLLFAALLLIIVGFVALPQTASAQCPSGWNGPLTTNITVPTTPPCTITIEYCWFLSPGGILFTNVTGYSFFDPNCFIAFFINPLRDDIILTSLLNQLNGLYPTLIPPCGSYSAMTFTLERAVCKYIENDSAKQVMYVKNCTETGVCRSTWSVCIDYSEVNPKIVRTFIGKTLDGSSECPDEFPIIPLNPPDGWKSPCFMDKCQ